MNELTLVDERTEVILEPHITLRCCGNGRRHGRGCNRTIRVPLSVFAAWHNGVGATEEEPPVVAFADAVMDLHGFALVRTVGVPLGTHLRDENGGVFKAAPNTGYPLVDFACAMHGQPLMDEYIRVLEEMEE